SRRVASGAVAPGAAGEDSKGDRLVRVRFELAGRGMVRHQEDRKFTERRESGQHRADYQLVDTLDRLGLQVGASHVSGLIGRLDMEEQEVARLQRIEPVVR